MLDAAIAGMTEKSPLMTDKLFPDDILQTAEAVLAAARAKRLKIATAESCTGGIISGALTEIAGSSDVFDRGFVTYSNEAKSMTLGVSARTLRMRGSVSRETASEMAIGALARSQADVAVAVTGIAGPGGGTAEKPVGLVHFASLRKGAAPVAAERHFGHAGRTAVRLDTVRQALSMLIAEIERA